MKFDEKKQLKKGMKRIIAYLIISLPIMLVCSSFFRISLSITSSFLIVLMNLVICGLVCGIIELIFQKVQDKKELEKTKPNVPETDPFA